MRSRFVQSGEMFRTGVTAVEVTVVVRDRAGRADGHFHRL